MLPPHYIGMRERSMLTKSRMTPGSMQSGVCSPETGQSKGRFKFETKSNKKCLTTLRLGATLLCFFKDGRLCRFTPMARKMLSTLGLCQNTTVHLSRWQDKWSWDTEMLRSCRIYQVAYVSWYFCRRQFLQNPGAVQGNEESEQIHEKETKGVEENMVCLLLQSTKFHHNM